jgi:gamma-glutamylcyclotransferase (GGCT)/AIG2-like uncharacterized protein YtfP
MSAQSLSAEIDRLDDDAAAAASPASGKAQVPAAQAPHCHHVFVYGTLRRGESNDINLLEPQPTYIGAADIEGTLYCLGWYPGLSVQPGSLVKGEVYRISPALEIRLDEIEGLLPEPNGEYLKRIRNVRLSGGGCLECLVYEIEPSALVEPRQVIEHGDWCGFVAGRFD